MYLHTTSCTLFLTPALLTLAHYTRGLTQPLTTKVSRVCPTCCGGARFLIDLSGARFLTQRSLATYAATQEQKGPTNQDADDKSTATRISEKDSPLFSYSERDLNLEIPLPALKYPVVIVHGYLGYASLIRSPMNHRPLMEYFGSVRSHLGESSKGGITVLTPVNPPAASIAARAKKLQLALGIKKVGVKETDMPGNEEDTKRQNVPTPTADGKEIFHQSSASSTSKPHPDVPIEFQHTGGQFDASKHESDSSPLEQHRDEERRGAPLRAAAAATGVPLTTDPDRIAQVNSQTGSLKTKAELSEEHQSSRDSSTSTGASIILGGQQISLNDYQGKFHLIAHSMGGLDCRYLISQLQGSGTTTKGQSSPNRIASLTTVSSPHRGSPVADMILDVIDVPLAFRSDQESLARAPTWNKFSQWLAGLFGIDVTGINNLSTTAMRDFNSRIINHPEVKYLSYGGARDFSWYSVWYWPSHWIRKFGERHDHSLDGPDGICPGGENDGLVSVGSAQWGNYCGTTTLDHLEQIGLGVWNKHLPLYRQIIYRLHEVEQEEEEEKNNKKQGEERTRDGDQSRKPSMGERNENI